ARWYRSEPGPQRTGGHHRPLRCRQDHPAAPAGHQPATVAGRDRPAATKSLAPAGPPTPAPALTHRPGASGTAAAAAPARGHGSAGRQARPVVAGQGPAQPAAPAGHRRCPGRPGPPGHCRQALPTLRPALRRPTAARRHRPRAVPGAGADPRRRAGLGHGPGTGRAHPGGAQPRSRRTRHDPGCQPACRGSGAGALPTGDRYPRRAHRLRPAGRRGAARTAGRAVCQRAVAGRAEFAGATPDGADPAMLKTAPRDPAALPRLLLTLLALVLLWPGIRISELDLAVLFNGDNARTMANFLQGFWPPAHDAEFLALLGRATLETLAIATAGMSLALLIAFPASLLASRALSLSAVHRGGRPAWWAQLARWPVRGLMIFLRSVPEIVWALLFVRAVGLGPTAGVLAIA